MGEGWHSSKITRNLAWDFVGICSPLVLALITIPQLVEVLGAARFGVLTLVWMVVGYGVFDMGLGRSLTKLVAERIDTEKQGEIPFLVWAALFMMVALGLIGALIIALCAPWFVSSILKIPAELTAETSTESW